MKLEREIIASIERQEITLTDEERAHKEDVPQDLIRLLDVYGLFDSGDLRRVLSYLDNNILRPSLDAKVYSSIIEGLRDYLEETS